MIIITIVTTVVAVEAVRVRLHWEYPEDGKEMA